MNEKLFKPLVLFLKREDWAGVKLTAVVLVFSWLFFVQGYATGYFEARDPLFKDVLQGFKRDGGEWSFGYFVPVIVAVLAWLKRDELLTIPVKPAYGTGFAVLLVGFLFYFGGFKANVTYGGYLAMQVLLAGACLWFLGVKWFFKTFWLWCLFGMMWPNVFLIQPVSLPLREVMVVLTSLFLNLTGVEALRSGMSILTSTPDPVTGTAISLEIGEGCSGLRSLFALVMIGFIFAAFALKDEWKRWLLMASIPLVAIVGNFVRMLLLYYGARFFGSEFAIGTGEGNESSFHIGSGVVVFIVALVLLTFFVEILNNGFRNVLRRKKIQRTVKVERQVS